MAVVYQVMATRSAIVAPAADTMALRFSRVWRVCSLMSFTPTVFPSTSSGTCFVKSSVPLALTAMLMGTPWGGSSCVNFRSGKTRGLSITCLLMSSPFILRPPR
jgi:hypothetical protein